MAIRANAVCTAVIHREESMSHRRAQPICCSVARRTGSGRGEDSNGGGVSGHVVRYHSTHVRGALPGGCMATIAIDRRHGSSDVARRAGGRYVGPGQGEAGGGMVKDCTQPIGHVVAGITIGWIRQSDMVRDAREAGGICALKCGIVAADASGRQRAAVVSSHVAGGARCRYVRAD